MRAVIYSRVSTKEQATSDKGSLEDQISRCKRSIDEHGWDLIKVYQDVQKGHEIDTRKSLEQLLVDAKDKKFDLVVFRDADRLSRDRANATIIRETLKDNLIQTYSVDQPKEPINPDEYDPDLDDSGVIMDSFADIKADLDIKSLRRKVRQGAKNRALRGEPHNVPYGYEKKYIQVNPIVKFDILINEQQADVVKQIFDLYGNQDHSYRKICGYLNTNGVASPTNSLWSQSTIKKILNNPFYTGYIRHNHRPVKRKQRIITPPSEWIMIKSEQIPVIIDQTLYESVQERMRQKYKMRGRAVASKGLLVGLAKCGYCGSNLSYKTNKRNYEKKPKPWHSYICWKGSMYGGKIGCSSGGYLMEANKLEKAVVEHINELIQKPQLKNEFINKSDGKEKEKIDRQIKQLERSLSQQDDAEKRIWLAYEKGYITIEEFGLKKDEFVDLKKDINKQIAALMKRSSELSSADDIKKKKKAFIKEFVKNYDSADLVIKKKVLQGLIREIIVKKNSVNINFIT